MRQSDADDGGLSWEAHEEKKGRGEKEKKEGILKYKLKKERIKKERIKKER